MSEPPEHTGCSGLCSCPVQRASPPPSTTPKPRKSAAWHLARVRAFLRTLTDQRVGEGGGVPTTRIGEEKEMHSGGNDHREWGEG